VSAPNAMSQHLLLIEHHGAVVSHSFFIRRSRFKSQLTDCVLW